MGYFFGYLTGAVDDSISNLVYNLADFVNKIKGILLRLLSGTVAMLGFGYAGEAKFLNPWLGFALGMAVWAFILSEVFHG